MYIYTYIDMYINMYIYIYIIIYILYIYSCFAHTHTHTHTHTCIFYFDLSVDLCISLSIYLSIVCVCRRTGLVECVEESEGLKGDGAWEHGVLQQRAAGEAALHEATHVCVLMHVGLRRHVLQCDRSDQCDRLCHLRCR